MVVKFTKVLPGWLRRCGVQRVDLDDAVQEALAAALVKLRELPSDVRMDDAAARHELMRIVSNVALRARRQAQREGERYLSVAHVEMPTARDEEMWVQARVVILAAIENLARREGLTRVVLETGSNFDAAKRVYERGGFVTCDAVLDYPPSAWTAFYEKTLST